MKTKSFIANIALLLLPTILLACASSNPPPKPALLPAGTSSSPTPSPTTAPPPRPVPVPVDFQNQIHFTVTSRIAEVLGASDPLPALPEISQNDFELYFVQVEYPQSIPNDSQLQRQIGNSEWQPVQLNPVHDSGDGNWIGIDSVDVGPSDSLDPIILHYKWKIDGQDNLFQVTVLRSWMIDKEVDARTAPQMIHGSINNGVLPDELDLEYFIIRASGSVGVGSHTLKVRSQFILAEPGSQIVSFSDDFTQGKGESYDSGNVAFQSDQMSGNLLVSLNGLKGADGSPGDPLPASAVGANGSPATTSIGRQRESDPGGPGVFSFVCAAANAGTNGQQGPAGNKGGPAGNGGNGGNFILHSSLPTSLQIQFLANGGQSGNPGLGSAGGPGGAGGASHDGDACGHVNGGQPGPQGPNGDPGAAGQPGQNGAMTKLSDVAIGIEL